MGYKGEIPQIHRSTQSEEVAQGPGVVYWIHFQPQGNNGSLRLRDGSDVSGEVLLTVRRNKGLAAMVPFSPPLPFRTGLYVDCFDSVADYTVCLDSVE